MPPGTGEAGAGDNSRASRGRSVDRGISTVCSILSTLSILAVVSVVTVACDGSAPTGTGEVVALDEPLEHVTIDHGDIKGLMPAMTMRFPVRSPDVVTGIEPGMHVRFELERDGEQLIVTKVVPITATIRRRGRPGFHDHTPHHGGVVTMVGLRHLEAVAVPDGRVRVYVSDVWRRPVALDGWSGTVTLDLPDGKHTVPFVRLLRVLPHRSAVTRSVDWSSDGTLLLTTFFYDRAARVLRASDGREARAFQVARECVAAAFAADGKSVVVASEAGRITLHQLESDSVRVLAEVGRPIHGLAAAGNLVIAAGRSGIIRVIDITTGSRVAEGSAGSPCYRLAVSPDGKRVACAAYDRSIRLFEVATGSFLVNLQWHDASVLGLAQADSTLLSGDAQGELALWDLGGTY